MTWWDNWKCSQNGEGSELMGYLLFNLEESSRLVWLLDRISRLRY